MKITAFVSFIIMHPYSFCQEISNIQVTQQGDKVIITYDLNDANNGLYYIKVYLSKDSYGNFNKELLYISGDVKDTKAGIGKKIVWEAKREIGFYNGSAQFKLEAISRTAPMPAPLTGDCVQLEITDVKNEASQLKIFFTIKATKANAKINIRNDNSYVFDSNGNKYMSSTDVLGNISDDYKDLVTGLSIQGYISYIGVPEDETLIPEANIKIYSSGECDDSWSGDDFSFKNLPIQK
ncbi:MAG: hypothetical protein HC905_23690 [Bacteroidales bacterium]|nr:hypothetical protein [Bacteroidales bacterium]